MHRWRHSLGARPFLFPYSGRCQSTVTKQGKNVSRPSKQAFQRAKLPLPNHGSSNPRREFRAAVRDESASRSLRWRVKSNFAGEKGWGAVITVIAAFYLLLVPSLLEKGRISRACRPPSARSTAGTVSFAPLAF